MERAARCRGIPSPTREGGPERIREQLQEAFDSRVIIEQAQGMIAAEHGIGVDEAFKRLRQHARSRNASLHSVAEAVVNLGLHVN